MIKQPVPERHSDLLAIAAIGTTPHTTHIQHKPWLHLLSYIISCTCSHDCCVAPPPPNYPPPSHPAPASAHPPLHPRTSAFTGVSSPSANSV